MSWKSFFLPLAALLVVSALWGVRQSGVAKWRTRTEQLRERLVTWEALASDAPLARATRDAPVSHVQRVASMIAASQAGGGTDMRAGLRAQAELRKMSAEELSWGLDELVSLPYPSDELREIQKAFFLALVEKDPALAMHRHVIGMLEAGLDPSDLSVAVSKWAAKDPMATLAWMNAQEAADQLYNRSLDERKSPLVVFEAALAGPLLAEDPQLVTQRLLHLSPAERGDVIRRMHISREDAAAQAAFLQVARDSLPPERQAKQIGDKLALTLDFNESEMTAALQRLQLSPEEREETVSNGLGWKAWGLKPDQLDEFVDNYGWSRPLAPEKSPLIMANALASLTSHQGEQASRAVDMALRLGTAEGDGRLLTRFLERGGKNLTPEQRGPLLEALPPGPERDQLVERFR